MGPVFLLIVEWAIVFVGVVLLAWGIHRRWAVSWHIWVWGAVTFVTAQLARSPLLIGLSLLFPSTEVPQTTVLLVLNVLLLGLSAGFFEETARYVMLRWMLRTARRWEDGVMFGAGHGGMEAILLIGLAVLGNVFLLLYSDVVMAQVRATSPEAVPALELAIEKLRQLSWQDVGFAWWERVIAITAHITLALMVLQAVRGSGWLWWAGAVVSHALLNITVVLTAQWGGTLLAEGIGTLFALAGFGFIRYARHLDRPDVPGGPDSPAVA